ncbi:hypothetical protein AKJ63_01780 [candidate division MSBL1 archaeon SCGC-AAA259D18]|uniref:Trimethylamine methyltransferase n=1 Tax=candidate division MSBL1 archaeon SCGC-AAA259D18 TaxID=1698262 RepID=A0A133UAK5_9EURY|nr:hypothetical protein AKJ63_01780 [candidate division MSBL1 archaeon SCGC-AAA259D18]
MGLKGFTRNFEPLKILSDEQVRKIHMETMGVLQETGVKIEHDRALHLLEKNGCDVDFDENQVQIPPSLAEECLRDCPSSFRIKARESENDLVIGSNRVYFATFPGFQKLDLETWEPYTPSRKEYYELITVLDALPNLHIPIAYPYFGFKGVPRVMNVPECVAGKIRNSSKVQMLSYQKDCEIFNIKMVEVVDRMEAVAAAHVAPPLTIDQKMSKAIFRHIEAGIPIWMSSGGIMGGSHPSTIAGSVVTNNAEQIAEIVLCQLIRKGTRILVQDVAFPQNMRTGAPGFGAIGVALHQSVNSQIWREYGIPSVAGAPGSTSSKKIDFQCGYEKAIGALIAALSGASAIQFHSCIYGEKTAHPVQAILDDDIAGMIGRYIEGVEVSDETLAIDLINKVGPIPGNYLNKEHTRKWWKKEQFVPQATNRMTPTEWVKKEKKDCIDHAKEKMREILETYESKPLTDDQEEAVENVLNEAREYYLEKDIITDKEWKEYEKQLESSSYPYE